MSHWPTCPTCHARRITRCQICGTAGTNFPPADTDVDPMPEADPPPASCGCGCGSGGCAPLVEAAGDSELPEEQDADIERPEMLMCPTCDEPFVPTYPRRCEWCGYLFEDGWEEDALPAPTDPLNARTVAAMVIVAALLAGMVGYLAWML